jgi:outer membrane immunogenic protein
LGVTLKKLSTALLGAIFLAGASGAASAADAYQRGGLKDAPEAYYPPITWAGFYAGVHAGGAFGGEVEVSVEEASGSFDLDNAFTGGAHIGYNWQASSHWLVGVEGSISALTLDASDEDFEWTDYVASIRGRAGVTFDQNLVYGTAGVAFVGYSDDIDLGDDNEVGFVIGAGWERKITDNISFGLEGLYYNFETDVDAGELGNVDFETDFFTVTARLNYHFNAGGYDSLK